MNKMLNFLFVLCFLLPLTQATAKETTSAIPVANNLAIKMIDSGYTMGDKLKLQASFELEKGETIDPDSLPLAGRVRPWLDIVHVDHAQSGQKVTLTTVWQLFATVEIAQQLTTPPIVLKTQGKQARQLQIPSQAFYYSPVLPLPPLKDIKRRANQTPPAFDTTTPILKFLLSALVFSGLALLWVWLQDALPWLPFEPGPMTRLSRTLKTNDNAMLSQAQLKQIHLALNESAGESLYADDLTPLIENAPYFANVQTQVADFFKASWRQFYAPQDAREIPANTVHEWVKDMAVAERLYRKQTKNKAYAG